MIAGNRSEKVKNILKNRILETIDLSKEYTDQEIWEIIQENVLCHKEEHLSLGENRQLMQQLFHRIRKLDILQEMLEDEEITEIMINGYQNIFIEKNGKLYSLPQEFESERRLKDVIQGIMGDCNRMVNDLTPIVDGRLRDGSRINVVMGNIALNGPIVTIRKFPSNPILMPQLIQKDSITQEAAEFLIRLVKAKYNIFISGGTGCGKTTFLNALSQYIPEDERIITIEDSAELQIQQKPNLVRLETRNENVEGCNEITIRDLIRASLRMRPDRIIVGEVRGPEALDMIQAMNTGHEGSISTGHANSTRDMLLRLESMLLMAVEMPISAIRRQISYGIDIFIQIARLRDGTRKVIEIQEVTGIEDGSITLHPIFLYKEQKTNQFILSRVGEIRNKEKMNRLEVEEYGL